MAENLGVAQLSLDVDLKGLEAGLQKAKQQIERFSVQGIKLDFGSADQQFRRLEASAKVFEAQLRKLSTTPLNLNASGLRKLGVDAQKAGADLSAFTRGVINGDRALANNIAGLQQQGAAFRTLAANVKIGTAEFRNFTQAAAQAGQKQLFAGFEEIKSLESLFKLGGSGGQSSFKGTEQLLAFSSKIGSTPAAINLYVQALKQAQSLTNTTDANFAKLTAEISRQRQALEQAAAAAERYGKSLKAPQLALPPGRGPSQFTFTGPTAEELAAQERNRRRQAKISSRIDYFSTGGRSTPDAGLLARPYIEAIQAERGLAVERKKTAAESLKASKTEAQQRQLAARRRSDVLSNALIGGAFPLLFGQGVGASFGGAAGGAAGGAIGGQFGFGLSLIGTALGAQFDTLLNKSKELADALQNPIAAFDQLKQASALSSRGLETYIQALINSGQTAKAEQLIRQDLTQNFNPVTADALSQANDELARSFSDVQEKLAAILAGPSIAFLEWLDEILDRLPINGPGGRTGELAKESDARSEVNRGENLKNVGLGALVSSILLGFGIGGPAGAVVGGSYAAISSAVALTGQSIKAGGERSLQDIDTERRTAATQREIEAIQARRVTLQRQLVGLTGDENSAAGQIAQAQNAVLTAEKAALEARKRFLSLPVTSSATEFATALAEFKAGIAAARIEVEKFIAANNNQARSLRKDNNLRESTIGFTPAARQGAELADASRRLREDYDKAQTALRDATPGTNEYAALQSLVNKIGEEWRGAALNVADYNAELERSAQQQKDLNADTLAGIRQQSFNIDRLSGAAPGAGRDRLAIQLETAQRVNESRREEVRLAKELESLRGRGTQAEVDNAATLLAQARARTTLAEKEGSFRLQGFDEQAAASAASERQSTLEKAMSEAMSQAKDAASGFKQAGASMAEAARSVVAAKEGAFKFLQPSEQRKLLEQARSDYSKVSIFKPLGQNVSDEEVLAAGNAARSVLNAQEQYSKVSQDLVSATNALVQKDWRVNVNVQGGDASAYGDVVNGALAS